MEFRNNIYYYIENENYFAPMQFELNKFTNNELHKNFNKGITSAREYNYLLNKFGLNKIKMENKTFFNIFIGHLFQPLYIYQIFSIAIWFYQQYYVFAGIIVCMTLVILLTISFQTYNNYRKILAFSLSLKCCTQRNLVK